MSSPTWGHRGIPIVRQLLVVGGYILFALALSSIGYVWFRGKSQEARVNALLRRDAEASVHAQYGDYAYERPPTSNGYADDGTIVFSLVYLGGQRSYGFSIVGELPNYLDRVSPLLGEHYFTQVTEITIGDDGFSDADVKLLLAFPHLRSINVSGTAITDRGLKQLASLKRLVELDVSNTSVSAEALRHLVECRHLMELNIQGTNATREVAAELKLALPDCWIFSDF